MIRAWVVAWSVAVFWAATATAQSVTLDEGMFTLTLDGAPLGTETFLIQRTGTGTAASILARGRIVRDDGSGELLSSLQLDGSPPRPTAYEIRIEGDSAQRVLARAIGRRLSVRTISPDGDRMREFLVPDGAALLDDGIAHQYFFVTRTLGDDAIQVPVIVPRRDRQMNARFQVIGTEDIQVGDFTISARIVAVEPAGSAHRRVWIDEVGRVLRLSIPDRGFLAQRNAPPPG